MSQVQIWRLLWGIRLATKGYSISLKRLLNIAKRQSPIGTP